MKPIEKIPDNLLDVFTLRGLIDVEYNYRDDSSVGVQASILGQYNKSSFEKYCNMVKRGKPNYYKKTDLWLYEALKKFPVNGKDVCILGSACPWYEAICITYGASSCDVLEYSYRPSFDERIKYIQNKDLKEYDCVFSISSFEHYGLGRYGDDIEPNGDIKGMLSAKEILKDNGVLFLSVPIGVDKVYFNVHRVYGQHRFPLLTDGFTIIDSFGVDHKSFNRTDNNAKGTPYQPIFILNKKI